jgi:hypothetical protein
MNIDFNHFFRVRVDITKNGEDDYQLVIERVDLEDKFYSSKSEFYLTEQQLKRLIEYFNYVGETNGLI